MAVLGDTYCLAGQVDAARAAWERALSLYGDVDQPEVERVRALLNDL